MGSDRGEQGTRGGIDGPAEVPGLLALHQNPISLGENCSQLSSSELILPVRLGADLESALVAVDPETGAVLGSCGACRLLPSPHPGRWRTFALGSDGFIACLDTGIDEVVILSDEAVTTCGADCFTWGDYRANDIPLVGHNTFLVHAPTNTVVLLGADQAAEGANQLFDSTGTPIDEELGLPPFWGLVRFGGPTIHDDRLIVLGNPGAVYEREYSTVFGVQSTGGPVRTDGVSYRDLGDTHDAIAIESGFLIAIGNRESTHLIYMDLLGQSVILGQYPTDPDPEVNTEGEGGRLISNGCFYSQVKGPGKSGILVQRCLDGTYRHLAAHPACDPVTNACIVAP